MMSNTHQKVDDIYRDYYLTQKKTLEINPRHPIIKELLRRVEVDPEDATAKEMALMMFQTATLRSGYMLQDASQFASNIDSMMKQTLGIADQEVDEEEELEPEAEADAAAEVDGDEDEEEEAGRDEL